MRSKPTRYTGGSLKRTAESVAGTPIIPYLKSTLVPHSLFLVFFVFFLAIPNGMWDLSSLTKDQTCAPCPGSSES